MLLLVLTLWSWHLRKRAFAILLSCGTLGFTLAGNRRLGERLVSALESQVPVVDVAATKPFDAVFVLGGGTNLDPRGEPEFGIAGDRIALAARLWHMGKARMLVASGNSQDGIDGLRDLAQETRTLWRGLGIPDKAILTVAKPCFITREEITEYHRLCEQHKWKRVALISSASHLPRAMTLANKAGLQVTPIGADWYSRARPVLLRDLIPQEHGFHLTHRALWEMIGAKLGR